MKRFDIPPSVTLVDGSTVNLAPVAMNKRFLQFMVLSGKKDVEPGVVVEAMLGCLGDCIKNGNPGLSAEEVEQKRELLPLNFVVDLIENEVGAE